MLYGRLPVAPRVWPHRAVALLVERGRLHLTLSDIGKLFDSYSRTARLSPALLVILPAFWTAVTLAPVDLDGPKASWFFSIIAGFGALYLLTSLARSRGKAAEDKLVKDWGGWPTTIALRHSNGHIDRLTKARY